MEKIICPIDMKWLGDLARAIFLSLCCLIIFFDAQAQKKVSDLLINPKVYHTPDKVVDIIEYQEAGSFIQVFSNPIKYSKIEKGYFAGLEFLESEEGLLISGNTRLSLRKEEKIVGLSERKLITKVYNYNEDYSTTIYSYNLINKHLVLHDSLIIQGIESSIEYNNNSNSIIINDEIEGFGSSICIYSENLELKRKYNPFNDGFQIAYMHSDSSSLFILIKGLNDNEFKMSIINPSNGQLMIDKKILIPSFRIMNISQSKGYYFITGEILSDLKKFITTTICFDGKGERLWQKNLFLSKIISVQPNYKPLIYNIFLSKLECINPADGEIVWSKDFKNKLNAGGEIIIKDIALFNASAILLLLKKVNSLAENFIVVNTTGELIDHHSVYPQLEDVKMVNGKKSITFLSQKKSQFIVYEKHL